MQRLSSSEQVVLTTVAYSDQFDFPLTIREIQERTPYRVWSSVLEIKKTLSSLEKKKIISSKNIFFCLAGRENIFKCRQQRQNIATEKWSEVAHFIQLVHHIPWVQAVFLTGAFALQNSDRDDDIDFLLVVAPGTLWLSRILVTFLALISGRRRSWQGEEKKSWCLNLWLDTEHLQMETKSRNLYTAYEIIQAVPVFDRNSTVHLFYQQNAWVKKYLPNWREVKSTERPGTTDMSAPRIIRFFDWLAWKVQLLYMQPHRTSEKIGRGFAFFHPRDTKGMILRNWQKAVSVFQIQIPTDTIK
jgi:hypothetical protein